jgi:hypothetical protein
MGAITLQCVTCSDPASWSIRTFQRGWCSHTDDGGLHAEAVRDLAPCVNRLDVRDLYLVVSAIAPVS